jgi:hypothetical protein
VSAMASPSHKRTYWDAFEAPLAHSSSLPAQESKKASILMEIAPHWEEHTNKENEAPSHQDRHQIQKRDEPEGSYSARCNLISLFQILQNRPLRTLAEHAGDGSKKPANAEATGPGFVIFEDETATSEDPDEVGMKKLVLSDK